MIDDIKCDGFIWDFDSSKSPEEDVYLLKWEATNSYNYIFETDDLSCIRGGSQLLQNFSKDIDNIVNIYKKSLTIQLVYYGGDQFLALVKGIKADAEKFGKGIVDEFMDNKYFGTSGYGIIDLKELWDDGHKEMLYAIHQCEEQIFRKRLSNLDVYPGSVNSLLGLDELDRLRLATKEGPKVFRDGIEKKPYISEGTYVKFEQGKDDRWGLIENIYNKALKLGTVRQTLQKIEPLNQDLSSLAEAGKKNKGYIAFLSVDGNEFTKIREGLETLAELCEFSKFIKEVQVKYIAKAIEEELKMLEESLKTTKTTKKIAQLAQLLFMAGDEFYLIVRGERGVEVARSLMDNFSKMCRIELDKYAKIKRRKELEKLSISIGLVFSHANTPIRLIREAASELRGNAKGKAKEKGFPYKSAVDFMVFESHPTTPDGIERYRKDVLEINGNRFYYKPYARDEFNELIDIIKRCKEMNFPRTQLHKIVSRIMDFKEGLLRLDDWRKYFKEKSNDIQLKGNEQDVKEVKDFLISNDYKKIIDFYEIYDYVH